MKKIIIPILLLSFIFIVKAANFKVSKKNLLRDLGIDPDEVIYASNSKSKKDYRKVAKTQRQLRVKKFL